MTAGLAAPALFGTWGGPWSPGTTANLLLRESVAGNGILGGAAKLTDALEDACEKLGVEIRTGAEVARIRVEKKRAVGVELLGGESIDAAVVASCADPKHTFLDLVHPRDLPLRITDQISVVRTRGIVARVALALSGPLTIAAREGEEHARIQIGETVRHLERAFDAAKHRRMPEEPHLDVYVPSVEDPDLAPDGHSVVSILVRGVPHTPEGGWTDALREQLLQSTLGGLSKHAPEVRDQIVEARVWTPADLERDYRVTGGHLHHGEYGLDQLGPLRPAASCARYRTPIEGLFLCGSGSHPGGGVTCAPGALAAAAIAKHG